MREIWVGKYTKVVLLESPHLPKFDPKERNIAFHVKRLRGFSKGKRSKMSKRSLNKRPKNSIMLPVLFQTASS